VFNPMHIFGNSLFAYALINVVWNSTSNGYSYHHVLQRECEAAHSITQSLIEDKMPVMV
jgi:hypothetical protein